MATPTFEEVLSSASQLPLADQLRLRDVLPVRVPESSERSTAISAPGISPFDSLAGIIDEQPQNLLTGEDQEMYGR